jgi:hypothetical protein
MSGARGDSGKPETHRGKTQKADPPMKHILTTAILTALALAAQADEMESHGGR